VKYKKRDEKFRRIVQDSETILREISSSVRRKWMMLGERPVAGQAKVAEIKAWRSESLPV
jgi:hypothetical protein